MCVAGRTFGHLSTLVRNNKPIISREGIELFGNAIVVKVYDTLPPMFAYCHRLQTIAIVYLQPNPIMFNIILV